MARPYFIVATESSTSPRPAVRVVLTVTALAVAVLFLPLLALKATSGPLLACSSTVEQTAVNRSVLGSIPSGPALAANNNLGNDPNLVGYSSPNRGQAFVLAESPQGML